MQILIVVIALLIGASIGGAIAWFVCQSKCLQAIDRALLEFQSEQAVTNERLKHYEATARGALEEAKEKTQHIEALNAEAAKLRQNLGQYAQAYKGLKQQVSDRVGELAMLRSAIESREVRLGEQQTRLTDLEKQVSQYQEALQGEQNRLRDKSEAASQQIADRDKTIEELRSLCNEREGRIRIFQDRITEMEKQVSQLQESLEGERKLAEEKLAVLGDAQAKLSDAFRALASEALKQNSTSFLVTVPESAGLLGLVV